MPVLNEIRQSQWRAPSAVIARGIFWRHVRSRPLEMPLSGSGAIAISVVDRGLAHPGGDLGREAIAHGPWVVHGPADRQVMSNNTPQP